MRFCSGTVATPWRMSASSSSSRAFEGVEVGCVVVGVCRVRLAEPVTHQLGVAQAYLTFIHRCGLGSPSDSGKLKSNSHSSRRDGVVAEEHDRRLGLLRSFGQVERRLLEVQAVDDDQVRGSEMTRVVGAGLEGVRVRRVGDDAVQPDAVAADVAREGADRRHRGGDVQLVGAAGQLVVPPQRCTNLLRAAGGGGRGGSASDGQDRDEDKNDGAQARYSVRLIVVAV